MTDVAPVDGDQAAPARSVLRSVSSCDKAQPNVVVGMAFSLVAFLLMMAGQAMSQTSDSFSFPTAVPQANETVLPNDPSFAEVCMAAIAKDVEGRGWRFGNSLLTHSSEFGRVWRIDFDTVGQSGSSLLVNRVICWQRPGSDDIGVGFSIGQPIAKLK